MTWQINRNFRTFREGKVGLDNKAPRVYLAIFFRQQLQNLSARSNAGLWCGKKEANRKVFVTRSVKK